MATIVKTEIEGAKEMDKLLKLLPVKMAASILDASVRTGAVIIRDDAKSRAPVDTGELRDSIRIQKIGSKQTITEFRVGPDKNHWYGIFAEFGTSEDSAHPFLRPAFDTNASDALDKIGEQIGKKIEARAKKLAGPLLKSGLIKRRRK